MVPKDRLSEIRTNIQTVLSLPLDDVPAIDYTVCLAFSNVWHKDQDSVWGYLVGPPGSGKSLLQDCLSTWKKALFVDELTENSLASGARDDDGNDVSLLPHLHRRVLCIRDFSTIINANPTTQAKILSSLRCVYDGKFAKASGKEGLAAYESKFGISACVTPAIDQFLAEQQQLGERFVIMRIQRTGPGGYKARMGRLRHIRSRMADKTAWKQRLQEATGVCLEDARVALGQVPPSSVAIPEEYGDRLDAMSDVVCRLRTSMVNGMPTDPEFGSRFVQELVNLVLTRAVLSGRKTIDESDVLFARRIAHDTLPGHIAKIFSDLYTTSLNPGRWVSIDQMCSRGVNLPAGPVNDALKQWLFCGLVHRNPENPRFYRLSDDTLEEANIAGIVAVPKKQKAPHDRSKA